METQYEVYYAGRPVGTACMTRKGLYYHISCICTLPTGSMARLYVSSELGTYMLGLLQPADRVFRLDTSVPIRRIGQESAEFSLRDKAEREICIELDANQPFVRLDSLERCRFAVLEGKPCLLMLDKK